MKSSFEIISNFVNRYSYPILLILFIAWMCIGIFPLQCYETDGQEIILGCDIMYHEGWSLPPVYSYEYRMQPLITILVVGIKHLIPFLSCEQIYCLLTAVASLIFLLGCILFAKHVTGSSKTKILLAAMLLPEMYAIAMYPNTAIFSAACLIGAMVLATRQRYWLSILLMAVAPLFRLDIVIVYPLILPLFYFEGKTLKQSFCLSVIYGLAVVGIGLFLFWLVGADALTTFDSYQKWNHIITPLERFLAIWGFYSLAYFILLPLGLLAVISKKRWKELFLILFPILLLHSIYSSFGNASKHFLYIAPFVIILGVRALSWMEIFMREKPVLKWATMIITVLFMTVSVRKQNQTMSWLKDNPLHQAGMVVPVFDMQKGDSEILVGLGAGYQIITNDEDMLGTGHLFYSWYIHCIKRILGEWRAQQKEVLDQSSTANVLTFEWGTSAPVASDYMKASYHFCRLENLPEEYNFTLASQQHTLHFWRVVLPGAVSDKEQLAAYMDSLSTKFLEGDRYVMAASNHYGTAPFLDELTKTGKIEKDGDKIYRINK